MQGRCANAGYLVAKTPSEGETLTEKLRCTNVLMVDDIHHLSAERLRRKLRLAKTQRLHNQEQHPAMRQRDLARPWR